MTDILNLIHDYEQSIMTITDILRYLHLTISSVYTDMNASKTIQPYSRSRKTLTVVGIPTATLTMIPQQSSLTSNPLNILILQDERTNITKIK